MHVDEHKRTSMNVKFLKTYKLFEYNLFGLKERKLNFIKMNTTHTA